MKKIFLFCFLCIFLVGCGEKKTLKEEGALYQTYEVGDVILFKNESWHVIKKSSEDEDYVVLLKDELLEDLEGKPYYECEEEFDNGIDCMGHMSSKYEDSLPKKYFDEIYLDTLGKENLKEIDHEFIRLITKDEVMMLGCLVDEYFQCKDIPDWLNGDRMIWTMSEKEDNSYPEMVYAFGNMGVSNGILMNLEAYGVGSTFNVRPVIHLLKKAIS